MKDELFREVLKAANEILDGNTTERKVINSFSGKYRFLSNFYPSPLSFLPVEGDELEGKTVEHVFQAAKTRIFDEQKHILSAKTPSIAKARGKKATLRNEWNEVRITIMRNNVMDKFTIYDDLADKLLATEDAILIEGNTWGDTFWGVCDGKGENWLGKILMDVRTEIQRRRDQSIGFGVN